MEPENIGGKRFRTAFVIILVVAVSALFLACNLAFPESSPASGALLAGLCHPVYRWITRLLRGRRSLGAIVTLLILFHRRGWAIERISRSGRATGAGRE
jgi:hypothetical protein